MRLIDENVNGLNSRMSRNDKLDKARELIDKLEVDIVVIDEHKLNLCHKDNQNGFPQLFRGGEADIRAVSAHNAHEDIGRVQEGDNAMLAYGPIIEQYDYEQSKCDELGLGKWSVMRFEGANNRSTIVLCGYNPCYN